MNSKDEYIFYSAIFTVSIITAVLITLLINGCAYKPTIVFDSNAQESNMTKRLW